MKWINEKAVSGFYTKLNVWGSLGLNFEYDGGPIIEIGGPIFLYNLRILEGSKYILPWGLSVVPRSVILRAMFGPLPIFWGPFEIFDSHILPSVKHNPIRFFFYKSWTCPYNMQGPS